MITSRPFVALAVLSLLCISCSEKPAAPSAASASAAPTAPVATASAVQTLEVGCGVCVFHMKGAEGCPLAVKIESEHYLVSGVDMPGHESGMCDHSRTADLAGKLEGDRFVATSMVLKP